MHGKAFGIFHFVTAMTNVYEPGSVTGTASESPEPPSPSPSPGKHALHATQDFSTASVLTTVNNCSSFCLMFRSLAIASHTYITAMLLLQGVRPPQHLQAPRPLLQWSQGEVEASAAPPPSVLVQVTLGPPHPPLPLCPRGQTLMEARLLHRPAHCPAQIPTPLRAKVRL